VFRAPEYDFQAACAPEAVFRGADAILLIRAAFLSPPIFPGNSGAPLNGARQAQI